MKVHPTAIIDSKAQLAEDVCVGAYSIIGAEVSIDSGSKIAAHVVIEGATQIGKDNHIFQFSSLGAMAQDKKYRGEKTQLIIGDRNVIREFCTFNRGTIQDEGKTIIGSDNWIMAYVHIAHDCVVGNNTVFANNASLAGHVHIEDDVVLGGYALVYQFVRIGKHSICAFSSGVKNNVPPYSMVSGMPAKINGINIEGLKRARFSTQEIQNIKRAHKILYKENNLLSQAKTQITTMATQSVAVANIDEFLRKIEQNNTNKRGLIR